MRLPLNYWLETIADDTIRESAIRQWDKKTSDVASLVYAIIFFAEWNDTNEKHNYWDRVCKKAFRQNLPLRPYTSPEGHTFNPDTGEWTMPAADHLPIREDKTAEIHDNTEVIEVTKCAECRFLQADNASRDWCRITQKDVLETSGIPDFCPLKSKQITVKLK